MTRPPERSPKPWPRRRRSASRRARRVAPKGAPPGTSGAGRALQSAAAAPRRGAAGSPGAAARRSPTPSSATRSSWRSRWPGRSSPTLAGAPRAGRRGRPGRAAPGQRATHDRVLVNPVDLRDGSAAIGDLQTQAWPSSSGTAARPARAARRRDRAHRRRRGRRARPDPARAGRARSFFASSAAARALQRERAGGTRRAAGAGIAGDPRSRPGTPPRLRQQPDRPDHRGHRPAGGGRRGLHGRHRSQPRCGASPPRSSASGKGARCLMPLGELHGIGPGTRVLATGAPFRIAVGKRAAGAHRRRARRSRRRSARTRGGRGPLDDRRPPGALIAAAHQRARRPRRARTRRPRAVRARPAPGDLRRARASASPRCWA